MELSTLRRFLMIAREGTISGAAAALHISQPSLSRQMQDLERELGCTLFIRGKRRIELTGEGMRLRGRAEEIVDLADRTEAEFRVSGATLAGEIRIGGGETPAMELVADVIAEMQEAYPLVRFSLQSGNAEDIAERLDTGRIDFGLFIGHTNLDRYEVLQVPAQDVWGVFMRADDPLSKRDGITPADLEGRPLIFSRQASSEMRGWFKGDFEDLDIVATYNAALLARRGIGYVVSLQGIVDVSESSGLTFRPLEPALTADVRIAWKRYQTFSPAAEVFLHRIRALWG